MKDFIKTYWFGLFILAFIAGCTGYNIYSSHHKEVERLQKQLEKEKNERRKQHIEDSIKATPAYIDSVRRREELYSDWKNERKILKSKEIVGFVYGDDSIYHSSFHWVHIIEHSYFPLHMNYFDIDATHLRFVTRQEVEELALSECSECSEINSVYNDYQDGELINREDAVDVLY